MCGICGATDSTADAVKGFCERCGRMTRGAVFITGQSATGYPNGSRVRKVNSEPGDGHPDGSIGTVLSSVSHPDVCSGAVFYFVEWDACPRIPIGVVSSKLEVAS